MLSPRWGARTSADEMKMARRNGTSDNATILDGPTIMARQHGQEKEQNYEDGN